MWVEIAVVEEVLLTKRQNKKFKTLKYKRDAKHQHPFSHL